jgi:uncharacterized protein (DUF1015 family)
MAFIKPFVGLRPPVDLVEKLAALPYDVMNSEEARELAKGNEFSFLHITKPEIDLEPGIDLYSDDIYNTAKNNLNNFIQKGYLVPDSKPCLYLYVQEMHGKIQKGLVVCASVDEYEQDLIKKHELTRKDKEDDRARHVYETNCNAGPVFLTYKNKTEIDYLIDDIEKSEPVYNFESSDSGVKVRNTFYVISDDDQINKLVDLFKTVPALYVADGHHRSASGFRVRKMRQDKNPNHTGKEEYNYFLTVLFPGNQLKILPYNRAVKDLNDLSKAEFLNKVSDSFDVTELSQAEFSPEQPKNIGMYLDKKWYKLTPKDSCFDKNDVVNSLDVAILQNNLLSPLLDIDDPRTNKRIDFIGGIRGVKELMKLVDSGNYSVAFSMYPTSVEELMRIADAGKIMPPKSTWFEPKLRSGMVIHLLD